MWARRHWMLTSENFISEEVVGRGGGSVLVLFPTLLIKFYKMIIFDFLTNLQNYLRL